MLVTPYRHDGCDPVLARGHHGGDGCVFSAEAGATAGVDAHSVEAVAAIGDEARGDVTEETITDPVRTERRFGGGDEPCDQVGVHTPTLPGELAACGSVIGWRDVHGRSSRGDGTVAE